MLPPNLNWEEDACATLPPLVSFTTGTPSSIFVQTVCCKRIGLLILILSWWSPLHAMDLCLASLHLGPLLGELLGPGPPLFCTLLQGWRREKGMYDSLFENLPENNAHVIRAVLTSIRISSFACSEYHFCTVRSLQEVPGETEAAVILCVNWSAESLRWLVGKFSSVCVFMHHNTIT